MSIDKILERLPDAKRSGSGWQAKCPAHDDSNPSLSISETSDGKVLVRCMAGCETQRVVEDLGLTMRDLFSDNGGARAPNRPQIVATYDYCDEKGEVLFQAVRLAPRAFGHRRPDGNGGWDWNLKGVPRVLFRLPRLIAADPTETVFVSEGEKDVLSLEKLGLLATTGSGGAGKWRDEYSTELRGRNVVILPDADEPGKKHAQQVARSLSGKAASVRIVDLPVPPKGDVSDWLGDGHGKEELEELAAGAPEWKPESETATETPKPTAADLLPSAFFTAFDLFALPRLPRISILAERMLFSGCYGLIYGPDGSAKSLATLHLMVALASGRNWFGLKTHGPMSTAYVQTDDDRDETTDRLIPIAMREHADAPEILSRIHILARPWPWGSLLDLIDPAVQDSMIAYIREHSIRVVAFDHVASCHGLPAYDFRPLIAAATRTAEEGECAVLFICHPSKAGSRAGNDGLGSDDIYGDSRFRNMARLRIRMTQTETGGTYRLRAEKISRGIKPEPIYLMHAADGDPSLIVTNIPSRATEAKAERIARIPSILKGHPSGMSAEQLAEEMRIEIRALRGHDRTEGVSREREGMKGEGG